MSRDKTLVQAIIERTVVVPKIGIVTDGVNIIDSEKVARQLDIALISVGFKADSELLDYISEVSKADAVSLSNEVILAVKTLVGGNVKHNVYFKKFPENVPDTIEFWTELIEKTYGSEENAPVFINLLDLDEYGQYQHTYEEMLKAHKPFVEKYARKLKAIKLGGDFQSEVNTLFCSLAGSNVPLNEADRELLAKLARVSVLVPSKVPVRENKAILNSVYLEEDMPLIVDTVGDVLRLAAMLSGGDVALKTKTRYISFSNKQKRALINALNEIPENKIQDVAKYKEEFKRLNERLHGGKNVAIQNILKIARGETRVITPAYKVESALEVGDVKLAIDTLEKFPGQLLRSMNRLLLASTIGNVESVFPAIEKALDKSSLRVILSLRQYVENRNTDKLGRLFINKKGGTYVVQDTLVKLPEHVITTLKKMLDKQIESRMVDSQIKVDPSILHYALPISERDRANGLNVVPRGTETWLDPEAQVLRFFVYWKQNSSYTDYDLSAIMLDENFQQVGQLSYTNLREVGGVHSGDITSAPNGASEFIDLELSKVKAKYIVPQVNIYSGDTFDEAKEAFFGYMLRSYEEKGKPFEAKTVETKSDLYGTNHIALPMVFVNTADGWKVKQLNMFLKGYARFNATENNASQTQVLLQSIVDDKFLSLDYLADMVKLKDPIENDEGELEEVPVKEITHKNLHEIITE